MPRKEILDRIPRKEILDRIQKYVHPFRITKGEDFRLKDFDPGDTCGLQLDKGEAAELRRRMVASSCHISQNSHGTRELTGQIILTAKEVRVRPD
jgi:hypothetical protein